MHSQLAPIARRVQAHYAWRRHDAHQPHFLLRLAAGVTGDSPFHMRTGCDSRFAGNPAFGPIGTSCRFAAPAVSLVGSVVQRQERYDGGQPEDDHSHEHTCANQN